jgi:hypothetical protein
MRAPSFVLAAVSALALSVTGANAQSVISAHSGVLHYFEGDLTLDGQTPHPKPGTFAEVKENQDLQTEVGRAEVLLTPGVFLRLGENTGIRMLSNKLTDTRVEFLKGSAIVDFVEVAKDNQVSMNYQDYKVTFVKKGIYRFDSGAAAEFKVYTGEAIVSHGTSTVNLKDGKAVPFTPALVAGKFDNRTGDALYRWAKRRSEYIAVANLSAARKAGTSFNSGASGWYYNPYYSMFTFIPGRGYMCDPFSTFMSVYPSYGCYYSPLSAYNYFAQPAYGYGYGGGRGYNNATTGFNSAGYYPTAIGTSSTLSTYSGNSSYSPGPSVSPSSSASNSASSSPGFSAGSAASGGGFSGGGAGGGGASHGGGSAGGHGR